MAKWIGARCVLGFLVVGACAAAGCADDGDDAANTDHANGDYWGLPQAGSGAFHDDGSAAGGLAGSSGFTGTAGEVGSNPTGGSGGTTGDDLMQGQAGFGDGTAGSDGAAGGGGTAGTDDMPPQGSDEVPPGEHCAPVADWDPMWSAWEEEVLVLTNQRRAMGATCGPHGSFGPADPLTMNAHLRCSARLHSLDMGVNGYFAHDSQDGTDPFERMVDAGYVGGTMGENIAQGANSPAVVVEGWMNSPDHCRGIMNPNFTEIGVGYWEGEPTNPWYNENLYWTQNFGGPGGGWGGDDCPWPWC